MRLLPVIAAIIAVTLIGDLRPSPTPA